MPEAEVRVKDINAYRTSSGNTRHVLIGELAEAIKGAKVNMFRYRLIDMAGSELTIIEHPNPKLDMGDKISMPDGQEVEIVEVYDDEYGREGDVQATLVMDLE